MRRVNIHNHASASAPASNSDNAFAVALWIRVGGAFAMEHNDEREDAAALVPV